MKKIIYILIFLLPIILLSCSGSNNEADLKKQLEIAEQKNQELINAAEAEDKVKAEAEATVKIAKAVPPTDTLTPVAKVQTKPSSMSVISWDQGKDYMGTSTTLCGPVIGTNTDRDSQGNPTHASLYIGKPFSDPGRFVVKISGRIRTDFANTDPENYYLGKSICITGLIKKIKDQQESGIPGIIVDNPSQIEMSVKSATTITLWAKDYSFSKTPIESSEYI
jgi:hypothetical protein